jgi:hypothetical protein
MAVGIDTLVLEMITPLLSKNPCPFNCAWLGPCRVDEAYAMLYPVSCEYIAAGWFVVAGANSKVTVALVPNRSQLEALCAPSSSCSLIILVSSMASSSSSNFQSIFDASLQSYNDKTKNKLLDHPLATQLQSCDSPNAVLSVLQDLIQQFDQRRTSDERLNNWLNPTVNVLYTFSATLSDGVCLVSLSLQSLNDL